MLESNEKHSRGSCSIETNHQINKTEPQASPTRRMRGGRRRSHCKSTRSPTEAKARKVQIDLQAAELRARRTVEDGLARHRL